MKYRFIKTSGLGSNKGKMAERLAAYDIGSISRGLLGLQPERVALPQDMPAGKPIPVYAALTFEDVTGYAYALIRGRNVTSLKDDCRVLGLKPIKKDGTWEMARRIATVKVSCLSVSC